MCWSVETDIYLTFKAKTKEASRNRTKVINTITNRYLNGSSTGTRCTCIEVRKSCKHKAITCFCHFQCICFTDYSLTIQRKSPMHFHSSYRNDNNTLVPQPAAEQKKTFEALLTTSLGEDCSLDVVQTVHDQICQRIEMHKEAKVPDPLLISKEDVKDVLKECGVKEEHLAKFSVDYDEAFGFEADLHPKNIIDNKHFEIKTPDVVIKVDPARSDLIETRIIGGVKYILICADENVEVNGVNINIADKEAVTV